MKIKHGRGQSARTIEAKTVHKGEESLQKAKSQEMVKEVQFVYSTTFYSPTVVYSQHSIQLSLGDVGHKQTS